MPLRIWTDSSAAIGICQRQGLGKVGHLDIQTLWIQQAVRADRVYLKKVHGESNGRFINEAQFTASKIRNASESAQVSVSRGSSRIGARDSDEHWQQSHHGRGQRRTQHD